MEKQYDSDFAKAKSRELVGKMLDTTLLTFRKPKDVRVLHFGGINLAEAKQIYLPRGILPSNIISVERSRGIAEVQESLGTGIKVVNADLEEYVNDPKNVIDFDVISLDYIGPLGSNNLEVLDQINSKQTKRNWILHHANSVRRDPNSFYVNPFSMVDYGGVEQVISSSLDPFSSGGGFARYIDKRKEIMDKVEKEEDIRELKSEAYSLALSTSFLGLHAEGIAKLFKFQTGENFEYYINLFEGAKTNDGSPIKIRENLKKAIDVYDGLSIALQEIGVVEFRNKLLDFRMGNGKIAFENDNLFYWASKALCDSIRRSNYFLVKGSSRYSYMSETGTPMIGDVYYLSHPYKAAERARDFSRMIGFPNKVQINNMVSALMELKEYISELSKFRSREEVRIFEYSPLERVFLGNSSKPVITKERALKEFESGASVEEVQQKYRGWTNKPLAQWKAHHTMGTYSSRKDIEEISQDKEDSDLEKITKEDAVDLLSSGVPPAEIYSCYPTSFSIGQLRAYKAHISMGTYKNGDNGAPGK